MSLPSVSPLRAKAEQARGQRDGVAAQLRKAQEDIKRLENEVTLTDLAGELLRKIIDQEVTLGVKAVERLQTEGLQAVFPDQNLQVKAVIDVQRGKVSVDLVTVQARSDGTVIEGESVDSFGGAVATLQSVLLRVIIVLRRGLRPLLVLDETLPALDGNYVNNVGTFLKLLCQRLKIDVLLVTHNPALVEAADHAYRIVRKDGVARFEETR